MQLLDAVNAVLKRVNVIAGDGTILSSLTDSGKQHDIDVCVQVINEGMDEVYSLSAVPLPKEQADATITLVANVNEYALASDLVQLRWPMIDRANSQYMFEFPGGYDALLIIDIEQTWSGLPVWGMINPNTNMLHTSHLPTSAEAGHVYHYEYDRDVSVALATDTFPFTNACFRAMVPVWTQLWKRERRNEFDQPLYGSNLGRASRFLTQQEQRTNWSPRA